MPENLTESDASYPVTVAVPLGSDSHSVLSVYIKAIAQTLANRTAWLKGMFARSNTWLTQQFYDTAQNPDMPMLVSTRSPADCNVTGTPVPSNPWRRIARLPTGTPNINVALYWGNGSEGNVAITYNCYWRPNNQRWRQEDAGAPSFAFFIGGLAQYMYYKAPGSADWVYADWEQQSTVYAKKLIATNEVKSAQFLFNTDVARITQLPLSAAFGPVSPVALRTNNRVMFDDTLDATAISKGIRWPIPLMPNNTIGTITVIFNIANAGDTFQWYRRRQNPDHSTSYTTVGSAVTTDGVNQAYANINEPSGIQDGDEYELCWKLQNSSDAAQVNSNKVYALQTAWTQYGPMGGGW